ncbi:MAG: sugar kinase [Clostridia bacterium]|nr:sugar kinase [Clostridia bacterium]
MAQLITIGEILVEIMATRIGQTFLEPGTLVGPYPSGAPAIMIDQAARLGADCAIVACVGRDDFGTLNIERLKKDGVNTSGIAVRADQTTGCAFVGYAADGSRKFIFHFTHAAAGALTKDDVPEALFEDVRIFHIMGCSLTSSASLREAVLAGARLAKEKGARLSFDPNIRPELLTDDSLKDAFDWIMENCDILLTGRSELEQVTGLPAEEAVRDMRARGKYAVVIKDGSRGARIVAEGVDTVMPSYHVTEVDPTGAGDCFDGAFLASLLAGKTLQEAASIGNAAGAVSVTRKGPMEGAAMPEEIAAIRA